MASALRMALSISMLNSQVNHARRLNPYALQMAETMGDRIRGIREARSLTQAEVGLIIGVTAATISQWESGTTKGIRPLNFIRFCAYFSVDPWTVVFGPDGDPSPRTPEAPKRFRFLPQRLP